MGSKKHQNQMDLEKGELISKPPLDNGLSLRIPHEEDTSRAVKSKYCLAPNFRLIVNWTIFAAVLVVIVVIALQFINNESSSLLTQVSVASDALEDDFENNRNLEDLKNHMNQVEDEEDQQDTFIYDVMDYIEPQNIPQPLTHQGDDQYDHQLSGLEIKHVHELKNMKSSGVVTIKSLIGQDQFSPESVQLPQVLSSVALTINGPISTMWVKEIVEKLPNMRNFTLDMDELCSIRNRNGNRKHPQITFRNVLSFKIENSHKKCDLQQWVWDWKFPKLSNLEFYSMNLNEDVFESVHEFLDEHKSTLKTIKVTESYICDDCFFSDVNYRDIQMVTILRQKDKSFK